MSIQNGSFAWSDKQTTPTLSNINMTIPRGKLVAVVGQVGSGKSSLMSAILGQMTKIEGRVETVDSIAYVAQQAWIQNASVKNNILFGRGMDWHRYNEIVCAVVKCQYGNADCAMHGCRCRRVRWTLILRFCLAGTRLRLARRASICRAGRSSV